MTFLERVTFHKLGTWFECQVSFIVADISATEKYLVYCCNGTYMALINEQKNNKQPPNKLKCVFVFKCVTLCCTINSNLAKCTSFHFDFKQKEIFSSVIYDCLECNAIKRNFNDYWIEKWVMHYLKVNMFLFYFIFRVNWKRNTLTIRKGCQTATVSKWYNTVHYRKIFKNVLIFRKISEFYVFFPIVSLSYWITSPLYAYLSL